LPEALAAGPSSHPASRFYHPELDAHPVVVTNFREIYTITLAPT
jgi:hypothetical protein